MPPESPSARAASFNEAGAVPLRKSYDGERKGISNQGASMRPERFRSGNLHQSGIGTINEPASMRPERFRSGNQQDRQCHHTPHQASMRPERFRSGNRSQKYITPFTSQCFNEAGAVPLRKSSGAFFQNVHHDRASMRPERFRSGNRRTPRNSITLSRSLQ